MKYTLQAGRSILKDDQPIVHLVRSTIHSHGDFAFTPSEADVFAKEIVSACNTAPVLTRLVQDAIEMLRWQASVPVGSHSWAKWVEKAEAALEEAKA